MRVALVTSTFLPNFIGGREKHVYGLAKTLIKAGIDTYIITGDRVKKLVFEEYDNIPVYRIPFIREFNLYGKQESIPYRIVSPSILFSVLDYVNPDIIHAHDIKHFTSDISALYSALKQKPYILTVHGIYYKPSKITKLMFYFHDLTLNIFTLKVARRIIVVSRNLIKFPITLFKSKIIYIPNAIEILPSIEKDHIISFRQKYKLPEDCDIVVSIGRVTRQKGFDILIRAWKIIRKNNINSKTKLLIIGPIHDRRYYEYLLKLTKNNDDIIFLGKIPEKDVFAAIHEAKIIVIASREEGFPTVLLEAIGFGKPIIATSVGSIPEIIQNGVTGLLVKPEDPESLAKALMKLLTDDKLRNSIENNVVKLRECFTWDKIAKYIIKVYKEII